MRRIPAIVLLLITSIGLAALIACQTIPGTPATATTPATPSTVSLTPGATVAIGNVEAIAAAIGAVPARDAVGLHRQPCQRCAGAGARRLRHGP